MNRLHMNKRRRKISGSILIVLMSLIVVAIPGPSHSLEEALQTPQGEKESGERRLRTVLHFLKIAEELQGKGRHRDAVAMTEKALKVLEKTVGSNHLHVANILSGLAHLNRACGEHEKAVSIYTRSLEIKENSLGPNHEEVAPILHSLAMTHKYLGDYASAEPLLRRSLAIFEKTLDPGDPDLAGCLHELASVYASMGEFGRAEPLFKKSLAIREKVFGPDHPDVAESLNDLADLYFWEFEWPKAESLFKRSLEIRESALGPQHPAVARSLVNLGGFYAFVGEYRKALRLQKRAMAIFTSNFGPEHLSVARCHSSLASIHQVMGHYGEAAVHLLRSLEIEEASLGRDHPGLSGTLHNLAGLYSESGKFREAHNLLMRGKKIEDRLIHRLRGFSSDERVFRVLATWWASLEMDLTIVAQHLSRDASFLKDALDLWLSRKGLVLDLRRSFYRTISSSDDPGIRDALMELDRVRRRIARLTFERPSEEGPGDYRKKMVQLTGKKRELEERLNKVDGALIPEEKVYRADCGSVAKALPEKSVLLEFARIDPFRGIGRGHDNSAEWSGTRYLAFVLRAGGGDRVDLIDLGPAAVIDRAVARFKNEMRVTAQNGSPGCLKTLGELHDLVFKPVEKALGGSRDIFISPDGSLNLIPFEVLKGPAGRFLIEDYAFNYLAAGRDILDFGKNSQEGGKALLMGDPDFNLSFEQKQAGPGSPALDGQGDEGTVDPAPETRGFRFKRLPGSREEVERIHALLGRERSEVYTGSAALEEVLTKTRAPGILHLATHGFFLKDPDTRHRPGAQAARGISPVSEIFSNESTSLVRDVNPLLRSGIALAGANAALESDGLEKSDGIVTAEEILGLKLVGTDMVVLSACETGVGELRIYEGIYGLRRAFINAGARSLVMSMWSVPDRETGELMIEFYKGVLSGRLNRCQALRRAALKQMKIVAKRYGDTNPFYWGAFVFLGEP